MPEVRLSVGLVLRFEDPNGILLLRPELALELQPPDLLLVLAEPELAEGDPHLGEPSLFRDGSPHVPDRIPGSIAPGEAGIRAHRQVAYRSRGGNGEAIRRAVAMIAVEVHREEIDVRDRGVPSRQAGDDLLVGE